MGVRGRCQDADFAAGLERTHAAVVRRPQAKQAAGRDIPQENCAACRAPRAHRAWRGGAGLDASVREREVPLPGGLPGCDQPICMRPGARRRAGRPG